MRRADRLFQLIVMLGRGRVATANELAEGLEVSVRTVYRDIQDLMASGVPIDGQAGVGYRLRRGYQLPPLMFTPLELEALSFGMQVARTWGDPELAQAAESVLSKVDFVVPPHRRRVMESKRIQAFGFRVSADVLDRVGSLRGAIERRRRVETDYQDAQGDSTTRTLWPLGLFYWGTVWSLAAWCELRRDFRHFRVDRIRQLTVLPTEFPDQQGFRLEDYMALMRRQNADNDCQ